MIVPSLFGGHRGTVMKPWIAAIVATGVALPAFAQGLDSHSRSQIENLMAAYIGLLDKKDAASLAKLYTEDAVVISPTSPTMVVKIGPHEIQTYLQYMMDHDYHTNARTTSITPLGSYAVIVVGDTIRSASTNQGRRSMWRATIPPSISAMSMSELAAYAAVPTPRQ